MIKKYIVITFVVIFCDCLYSQSSQSPYSYYGIGLSNPGTTAASSMLQGLSVYKDSLQINLKNPASYGELKLINLSLSADYYRETISSIDKETSFDRFNMVNFSVSVPLSKKTAFGFGLMPYYTVNHDFSAIKNLDSDEILQTQRGNGGINQVYLSFGHALFKGLSIGASFKYNFGVINSNELTTIKGVELSSSLVGNSKIGGFSYDFGVKYNRSLLKRYRLYTSLSFSPEVKINSDNTRSLSALTILANGNPISRNTLKEDLEAKGLDSTPITLPVNTTLGLGIGKGDRWFVGVEYTFLQQSQFSFDFLERPEATYKDGSIYRLSGYFAPTHNAFSSYFNKITYRAGISYNNTGLSLYGEDINIIEASLGFGLPIGDFNKINLGFGYGRRGIKTQKLIQEDYFNIKIGFSFNDLWFIKRKYN